MKAYAPDYVERRDGSVLLVWGGAPFWLVVDEQAAAFIEALCQGEEAGTAMRRASGGRADAGARRQAAALAGHLRRAGVLGGRAQKPPAERIESITVNVTNRCPLRCAFCYNGADRQGGPELSADEMIGALEGLRRWMAPGALLALLGGEPLLEKQKTLALAAWARRRGLPVIVSTNGLLVDEPFAREAARLDLACQVSIDGASADTHDRIRGEGTFDRAVAGVRTLIACGAHTILCMVVHAGSVGEIPAYLRMAKGIGAQEARFIPVKRVGSGTDFEPPDLPSLVAAVADLIEHEPGLARLLGRDWFSILARTCRSCSPRQGCGTGSQTFLLDADGTVYPCPNLASPEMAAGSVSQVPVDRIWIRSDMLRRVRTETQLSARQACRGCLVRHWCLGGCRGETYAATRRLDAPSPTCAQQRAAVLEMFWRIAANPGIAGDGKAYC